MVLRGEFSSLFTGRTALMATLMQERPAAPAPSLPETGCIPTPKAETTPEPAVSTPDAWLERRLRVFERALNALEAKADATAEQHARAIALLKERLAAVPQAAVERRRSPREVGAAGPAVAPAPVEAPQL